ncbi:hypothetical protein [Enterococcus italicus]|uniref:hypothetical protein n=1 Tax=Enterococcus italicus TaxID=246144 RepID=UPI0028ABFA33|nr:hypothetical protein [Enterococcus italicus]
MKQVRITTQGIVDGTIQNTVKTVEVDDNFDLRSDYYDYLTGTKAGANGNAVPGAMIGENTYVRFADVIDIEVVEIKVEEVTADGEN